MKVLVIVGPTGVGKTSLSVNLAKALDGEIISGDSVQVYKKLDIGSAKITTDDMEGVPHHLVDFLEPYEEYSVARFQKEVRTKIEEISSRGKLPIICGGTGLYIKAALTKYEFQENIKRDIETADKYNELSNDELHQKLKSVDPESAELFHPNNRRRVLRAVEYFERTKDKISNRRDNDIYIYNSLIIGLRMNRSDLYDKINKRVDIMVEDGLIDEVKSLLEYQDNINAIGYNEVFQFLDDKVTLEESVELIKMNTRRYAKRQFTWFNNKMDTNWIDIDGLQKKEILNEAIKIVKKLDFI
ncbi:tRNA (adenosine(37)-N6)-dimethylallyltransferase MiaA [Mycoplasmatota bacterium WC44]